MTQHTPDLGWGQQCPWQAEGLASREPYSQGRQQAPMARVWTGAVGVALGPQAAPRVLLAPTAHPRQSTGSSLRWLHPSSGEGSSQHRETSDQCKEQQLQKLPMLVSTS